jgi:hypothetical protein
MKTNRRPYSKPQIEKVQLIVEEAILANCKQPSQRGAGTSNCKVSGIPCSAQGS